MLFQSISVIFTIGLLTSSSTIASASKHRDFVAVKRQTITSAHQFEVLPESDFPDGSDALKGISPASGPAGTITAHQFQSDCTKLRGAGSSVNSYMSLAAASCGLPYEAMESRGGKEFCSGFAASNFATGAAGGCGACIELTYNGKQTYVRVVGNHGGGSGFDISWDNYVEIASPADYAKADPILKSGAGTNPLEGGTYQEVDGSKCDMYWDGRCLPNIYPGISAASTHWPYGCS